MADLISRDDVEVLEHTVADELTAMGEAWQWFENLVGLKGRKMFARIDEAAGTYTVCTPRKPGDSYDLAVGVLAGGRYRRTVLEGEPPELYGRIGPAVEELKAAGPWDSSRPLVEFYRRHTVVELWVPIT
ncbi:GyrI-like domain-containing protein [Lentzea aerocolonigenes]|uniref:GyrI-like domain-containing protein n=1 Tax=Lentzea aerocolonigenes TaxID=68170 RepID=UPI000697B44B|nr:GyrI-like domain-containing protein [Lentzea aerocolonigenes]